MAEEEIMKVGPITFPEQKPPAPPALADAAQENASFIIAEAAKVVKEKKNRRSGDRDTMLARVETEKKMSLIKAWEDSETSKAQNKVQKKISAIGSWERSKTTNIEAELNKIEEKLERQKAERIEKLQNKIAMIQKSAEEKRAMVEAKRGEHILKAEEMAAKYHATGTAPKKLGLF